MNYQDRSVHFAFKSHYASLLFRRLLQRALQRALVFICTLSRKRTNSLAIQIYKWLLRRRRRRIGRGSLLRKGVINDGENEVVVTTRRVLLV